MKTTVLFTLAASLSIAQNVQFENEMDRLHPGGKDALKSIAKGYAIPSLEKLYGTTDGALIEDLRPLLPYLNDMLLAPASTEQKGARITSLHGRFSLPIREDADHSVSYSGDVRIFLTDSFAAAEKYAAFYLSNISVRCSKGSFSGVAIGDWTASLYSKDTRAILYFLKKNAFVVLAYNSPREVLMRDPRFIKRQEPDPTIKFRCEQLGQEIADQLGRLPLPADK